MADTPEEVVSSKTNLVIPQGFPEEVYKAIQSGLKPAKSRAIVFENEKQRNATFIQKGLTKPGKISYDTLRRAANSVHVARICINALKEKITKTKWVIKSVDPTKEVDDVHKKKIEKILRNPNRNSETFRTLLDKMMEDLLVLDAVSVEKTRFDNGELAELYFVDSATIRPVFDEYGNQDILIPLNTKNADGEMEALPVSYLQILNNSQYGGPESGDVIAAWPKKDLIHFHQHPQGSMEGFGYGLSPIEGVLSVVSNLLNADNYNSTYFEEGSFPPIVLHLAGQISQRDAEAFREYMYQEMTGNFHRPAFMAGGEKMEVIDLKSDSNRDMQFMEYTIWLAKLMCAAYGLAPQDIGITDSVGSKNVAETQKDLSEAMGYGSILALLKQVINEQIIADFGFEDIEFDWVAPDTMDPQVASTIYDQSLKNGTMTINEVREKTGETPFGDWADEPMILTSEGTYVPLDPEKKKEVQEESEMDTITANGEKPESEQKGAEGKPIKKSRLKTMYIYRPVKNAAAIIKWAKEQGFAKAVTSADMHVTIAFSKNPVDWDLIPLKDNELTINTSGRDVIPLGNTGAVVLRFNSEKLQKRWKEICEAGASWDNEDYKPHATITFDGSNMNLEGVIPYDGEIILGPEKRNVLNEDWAADITEKMQKAILTQNNHKTWADDRGYSQPFIWNNVISGTGQVIKPPVAVNLQSQTLEIELTAELAAKGLNVKPVVKMSYVEVVNMLRGKPDVFFEFEKYVNMTPEYDSEKWRSKLGGSRKFAYYLVSDYIDGYALNNPLLIADMKRDTESYEQAARDLARLCKTEKDMVLGDRRPDQYIIGNDKRAYGLDYQFEGDFDRWNNTKDSIKDVLVMIPELLDVFKNELNKKGIKETIKSWRR